MHIILRITAVSDCRAILTAMPSLVTGLETELLSYRKRIIGLILEVAVCDVGALHLPVLPCAQLRLVAFI